MGLSESKQKIVTKEKRIEREKAKVSICEERKKQIDNVQKEFLEKSLNSNSSNSNAIVSQKDIVNMVKITEKAKNQLDRVGSGLTKPDLVAIIIALKPEMNTKISQLENLTVSDLNTMIRSIIYDPSRVINNKDNKEDSKIESLQNKKVNMNTITFVG